MLNLKHLLICLRAGSVGLVLFGVGLAQQSEGTDTGKVTARDYFWPAIDVVAPPAPHHPAVRYRKTPATVKPLLGLRFSVLQLQPDKTFREVSPRTTFHTGDSVRLSIKSNQEGYLYVIHQASNSTWRALYPRSSAAGVNRIEPNQEHVIPGEPNVWKFAGEPGLEKLFILLSHQPSADLDQTIYAMQQRQHDLADPSHKLPPADAAVLDASNKIDTKVNELRGRTREMIETDEFDPLARAQNDKAMYAVEEVSAKTPNPQVILDVVLRHQ